jgi:hypothetical protein
MEINQFFNQMDHSTLMSILTSMEFELTPDNALSTKHELTSSNGFKITWYSRENNRLDMTFQVIVAIRYKDSHITTWGHTDNETTVTFLSWWNKTKQYISQAVYENERKQIQDGRELMFQLYKQTL